MPDASHGVRSCDQLQKFFNIVVRLSEIHIKIDDDLLTVLLFYNLPSRLENFRYAKSLPRPQSLLIKIAEENNVAVMMTNKTATREFSSVILIERT